MGVFQTLVVAVATVTVLLPSSSVQGGDEGASTRPIRTADKKTQTDPDKTRWHRRWRYTRRHGRLTVVVAGRAARGRPVSPPYTPDGYEWRIGQRFATTLYPVIYRKPGTSPDVDAPQNGAGPLPGVSVSAKRPARSQPVTGSPLAAPVRGKPQPLSPAGRGG